MNTVPPPAVIAAQIAAWSAVVFCAGVLATAIPYGGATALIKVG